MVPLFSLEFYLSADSLGNTMSDIGLDLRAVNSSCSPPHLQQPLQPSVTEISPNHHSSLTSAFPIKGGTYEL